MSKAERSIGIGLALFMGLSGLMGARPAEATVLVQDTDLVNGEYVFEINYANVFSPWSSAC